jgi:hypothetical protein
MEWRHLPVAGGVYGQHPDFLEGMLMLKEARGRYEEKKRNEEESKHRSEAHKAQAKRGRRK